MLRCILFVCLFVCQNQQTGHFAWTTNTSPTYGGGMGDGPSGITGVLLVVVKEAEYAASTCLSSSGLGLLLHTDLSSWALSSQVAKKKRDPKSKTWMWAICWSGKTFLPLHQLPILRSHISILKRPSDAWWPWAWAVILLLAHSIFLATSIASSYLHLLKRIICYWCLLGASARCNGATFA